MARLTWLFRDEAKKNGSARRFSSPPPGELASAQSVPPGQINRPFGEVAALKTRSPAAFLVAQFRKSLALSEALAFDSMIRIVLPDCFTKPCRLVSPARQARRTGSTGHAGRVAGRVNSGWRANCCSHTHVQVQRLLRIALSHAFDDNGLEGGVSAYWCSFVLLHPATPPSVPEPIRGSAVCHRLPQGQRSNARTR